MTRVALYGNVANVFAQLAPLLRGEEDLDVHLYVDDDANLAYRPESDNPELATDVSWIHLGAWNSARSVAAPWRSPLIDEFREADVLLVSDTGPMYAPFARRPYAFFATGADLTMRPFPVRFLTWREGARRKAGAFPIAYWQRRGIRHASEIWAQPFGPFLRAEHRLGLDTGRNPIRSYPLAFDAERFARQRTIAGEHAQSLSEDLRAQHDFVLFHPSRLVVHDDPRLRETGQWKANDVLVRGFARYLKQARAERPVLAMPRSSMSRDVALVRALIDELGIERNVRWLVPEDVAGFRRYEMPALYEACDVVADDFGAGWFGLVVLEAFALRKPAICHIDQEVMAKMYPWNPICEARDEKAIAEWLLRLELEPGVRAELGLRGRSWVDEFHGPKAIAPRYAEGLRALAARVR